VAPRTVIESWMSGVPVVATRCTPFFEEVSGLASATELVPLPPEPDFESRDRARLRIEDPSTRASLAAEMLSRVLPTRPTDVRRREIAVLARANGFSANDMVEGLRRIYESVAGAKR
jgi:hypothetical protein